jgi:DNA-binding transcriptional MerR regulator
LSPSATTSVISEPAPPLAADVLRIGELAQRAGVTTRTLRYWEQMGLVAPSGHLAGGRRVYSQAALDRVSRIKDLQCLLGLSLAEIRAVLDVDDTLDRIRTAYHAASEASRRRRLLVEAIQANDLLVGRLDDSLRRIESFRRERIAKGQRLRARAAELDPLGV